MSKILFSQAKAHSESGLQLVPFTITDPDAKHMELFQPVHNRSDAENRKANQIASRLAKACRDLGLELVKISFQSMHITIRRSENV